MSKTKKEEVKFSDLCRICKKGVPKRTICEKTLANVNICDNCGHEEIVGFGR